MRNALAALSLASLASWAALAACSSFSEADPAPPVGDTPDAPLESTMPGDGSPVVETDSAAAPDGDNCARFDASHCYEYDFEEPSPLGMGSLLNVVQVQGTVTVADGGLDSGHSVRSQTQSVVPKEGGALERASIVQNIPGSNDGDLNLDAHLHINQMGPSVQSVLTISAQSSPAPSVNIGLAPGVLAIAVDPIGVGVSGTAVDDMRIAPGSWIHLRLSIQRSTGRVSVFLNGDQVLSVMSTVLLGATELTFSTGLTAEQSAQVNDISFDDLVFSSQ